MQKEVLSLLKDKYQGMDWGWYSNHQIHKLILLNGYDVNISAIIKATKKLYRSKFLDRVPNGKGHLYRYKKPRAKFVMVF